MPIGKNIVVDEFDLGAPLLGDNLFKGALVVVDNAHHEIHCGDSYLMSASADLANGASDEYLVSVPDGGGIYPNQDNKTWHLKVIIDTEAEALITVFEAPTVSLDGTPLTSVNRNRNSTHEDFLDIFYGPTITDDGTQLAIKRLGSSIKEGGVAGREVEFVLANNTDYLIRILNATAVNNYYNIELDYYVQPGV